MYPILLDLTSQSRKQTWQLHSTFEPLYNYNAIFPYTVFPCISRDVFFSRWFARFSDIYNLVILNEMGKDGFSWFFSPKNFTWNPFTIPSPVGFVSSLRPFHPWVERWRWGIRSNLTWPGEITRSYCKWWNMMIEYAGIQWHILQYVMCIYIYTYTYIYI